MQEVKRVVTLKKLWLAKVALIRTLAVITRVLRLLHNLLDAVISNKSYFAQRPHLVNSVLPAVASPGNCHAPQHLL